MILSHVSLRFCFYFNLPLYYMMSIDLCSRLLLLYHRHYVIEPIQYFKKISYNFQFQNNLCIIISIFLISLLRTCYYSAKVCYVYQECMNSNCLNIFIRYVNFGVFLLCVFVSIQCRLPYSAVLFLRNDSGVKLVFGVFDYVLWMYPQCIQLILTYIRKPLLYFFGSLHVRVHC